MSKNGIDMFDDKVLAIQEAMAPTNVNEIASILGYVSFYQQFVEKLAKWAVPVYALLKRRYNSTRQRNAIKVLKRSRGSFQINLFSGNQTGTKKFSCPC